MFKPMLAATAKQIEDLEGRYPFFASPKLDGVRALVLEDRLVSRNLKPIPNKFVQEMLPLARLPSLDGELIVGKPWSEDCFRSTTSGVMSEDGEPDVCFYVFDVTCGAGAPFTERHQTVKEVLKRENNSRLKIVPHTLIKDAFALYEYEQRMLEKGFEGVMLRDPEGSYKQGRSTLREGGLVKLKRFSDSEAIVIGFEELMHNENEKTLESGGKAKRSSHKAGLVPMNTLGTLLVRDIKSGVKFGIGSGFTAAQREAIWKSRNMFRGKVVKYKFFPSGSKEKPRFPVFLGVRDPRDMD
jgi:DNA ligase-1